MDRSRSRKRAFHALSPTRSLSNLPHHVLVLILPFLSIHTGFRTMRLLNREFRDLIDQHLFESTTILLDGRIEPLTFSSTESVEWFFRELCNLTEISCVNIFSASVNSQLTSEQEYIEKTLSDADLKTPTSVFPLGIFDKTTSLTQLHIESTSVFDKAKARQGMKWYSLQPNLPLQIGLANLHEISRSCPDLEVLLCYHVERDKMQMITDLWGPDCTPQVARQLRTNCSKLREMGVLSSPGPRMLRETRRMGTSIRGRPLTEAPELQEAFDRPFLSELQEFSSSVRLMTSVTAKVAPGASGRGAVLRFREEFTGIESEGELRECVATLASFTSAVNMQIIVRAPTVRFLDQYSAKVVKEQHEISTFRQELLDTAVDTSSVVRVYQVPSEGRCTEIETLLGIYRPAQIIKYRRRSHLPSSKSFCDSTSHISATSRSTSFTVHVSTEPLLNRSFSMVSAEDTSFNRSYSNDRQFAAFESNSALEPEDISGSLIHCADLVTENPNATNAISRQASLYKNPNNCLDD